MKIVIRIISIFALFALCACATGRTAFDKAQQLEKKGKYEEALQKYAEAVANNPDDGEYRMAFLKAGEKAAKINMKAADDHFAAKRFDQAFAAYQKALAMDPSLEKAKQQGELIQKMRSSMKIFAEAQAFEKENKQREAVRAYQKARNIYASNREAAEALERILKTRRIKSEGYELNLKSAKPITLKFKDAKTKDVFNIITQLSGINFVFDDAFKDTTVSIYLENATFQQVMEIICNMQKLGRKVLNENTIILYAKTPDKVKQYEDLYVQTFFLNKLDAKKAVNLVRTMLQVKKIYVNEEMNTLVIRDTLDVIEVARRILEANDVPDAEVVLEVEVIEMEKKNAESFGLALSRYAIGAQIWNSNGALSDSLTTATTTTATGTTGTTGTTTTAVSSSQMLNLFRWGDYRNFVTVPSATFNFGKTLGNAQTLSNPKIRVKNREKAKFNVGTRVPITTTSSNGVGSYNVNVQYVDVGVKINAEPTIQLNNDVNIKLGLEVSSILSKEKVGTDQNTQVVTIGTRNMDTVLSLKDGETSVIGGLIQDSKGQNSQKIWLLGDIPVIGALFSNHDNSGDKTELVLAITPRIIRGISVSDPEVASFWSGVEDDPSTTQKFASFVQEPEFGQTAPKSADKPAAAAPAAVGRPVQPAQPLQTMAPAPPAQVPEPKPVQNQSAPPVTQTITEEPIVQQLPAAAAVADVQPLVAKKVSLKVAAPASVKAGEQFAADIIA
ncbi:MAG: type II secretion system protein, partial [Geobacter sp.]|nr:type II secretion system protein [Geobacter sp.]